MPLASSPDNSLIIAGQVAGICETRTSPAGVPISRFLLEHQSEQVEAGVPRQARCRIPVIACGPELARLAGRLPSGAPMRVQGFVSRVNYREGEYRLALHAARIDLLNTESSED
ncbi:MAG: primosomal replication protein N [Candidatus Competibacteraceae bacterium]